MIKKESIREDNSGKMTLIHLKRLLRQASTAGNRIEVEEALGKYEDAKFYLKLDSEADLLSKKCLKRLEYLNQLADINQTIQQINRQNIAEISSFNIPPKEIHNVILSLMYLLGTPLEKLQSWNQIRTDFGQLGRNTLKARIDRFDPNTLTLAMCQQCQEVLEGVTVESMKEVSKILPIFYKWVNVNSSFFVENQDSE